MYVFILANSGKLKGGKGARSIIKLKGGSRAQSILKLKGVRGGAVNTLFERGRGDMVNN